MAVEQKQEQSYIQSTYEKLRKSALKYANQAMMSILLSAKSQDFRITRTT